MKLKVSLTQLVAAVGAHLESKVRVVTPKGEPVTPEQEVELESDDLTKVMRFLRKGEA